MTDSPIDPQIVNSDIVPTTTPSLNNSLPKKKRTSKFAPNPRIVVELRQQRLYKRQLDGLSPRQLVYDHASKEGVSLPTAWTDWRQVNKWNEEDWASVRESMISRIQTMRIRLFHLAVKRGQLQTAAQILDSLGKVVGESTETISLHSPELAISIQENKSTT